jgi:HEPN domain-containing protein
MLLFPWVYATKHSADEWFRMAHAYGDAAVALFEDISAARIPQTYHHAMVAAAAFEHALELFLKSALVLAGKRPKNTHNLETMLARYRTAYPGQAYAFEGRIDDAARRQEARPFAQFLRYPESGDGAPWPGSVHFDLDVWMEQARLFRDDYRRLEPLLREKSLAGASEGSDCPSGREPDAH